MWERRPLEIVLPQQLEDRKKKTLDKVMRLDQFVPHQGAAQDERQ
jgi:hypothetical protein